MRHIILAFDGTAADANLQAAENLRVIAQWLKGDNPRGIDGREAIDALEVTVRWLRSPTD